MAGPLRKKPRPTPSVGKSLTAKVNQLIANQEYKIIDVSNTTLVTGATGTVVPLNSIAAGDDITQRNGRKINMTSSMLRFHLFLADGVPAAPMSMRLALVYDRQPNGAAPVWTDVFQTAVAASDRNVNNRDRFKIVYDNYNSAKKGYLSIATPTGGGTSGYESGFYDQNYAKLTDMTVEFATTASAVPLHGGYFLFVLTDGTGALNYYHRVTFTDS